MANNRMYLTNKRTGSKVLLAKYYPSTGWYVFDVNGDRIAKIDAAFDESDFGHLPTEDRALPWNERGACAWGGMDGGNDWFIEYEVEDSNPSDESATETSPGEPPTNEVT